MKALPPVLFLVATALFAACDDNPVDETQNQSDPTKADQVATVGFQALGDTLEILQDRDSDELRDVRFDDIRSKLEEALTYESNNGIAHLGLSIVEVLELNYSSEIWEVIDSLDAWQERGGDIPWPIVHSLAPRDPHRMLIGRQFELMAMLPIATSIRMTTAFPPNLSVARIQDIITDTIRPAFNRAVSHLDIVENQTDTELRIHIDDNGVQEDIVVDLGEILVFSAGVRALRAGFGVITAYDVDLWGPDDTYDWLDHWNDLDRFDWCRDYGAYVTVTDKGGGHVDLDIFFDYGGNPALQDSILIQIAYHNLEVRDDFLALRDGGAAMRAAHTDLLGLLSRLESAAEFIRNRPNETEENVIKLADLTDLDADINDPGRPNFMQRWSRVEDAIDFVDDLLTGPVTFTEELGPNHVNFTWTVDLSRVFLFPIDDWNDLAPFHRWNLPAGAWLTDSLKVYSFDNGGYYFWVEAVRTGPDTCTYMEWEMVDVVTQTSRSWDLDGDALFDFLDGPNGDPIDLEVARFPYVPDYTFDGIFPSMSRDDWVELIDIFDTPDDPDSLSIQGRVVGVRR